MRVVIDTNVIVSGLYDLGSPPGRILAAAAAGVVALCAPDSVRAELERVLIEVLEYTDAELRETLGALPIEWLEEGIYRGSLAEARRLLRDPDDAPVLAAGLAIGCDIVSGDKDLHAARQRTVRVWKPSELASRRE